MKDPVKIIFVVLWLFLERRLKQGVYGMILWLTNKKVKEQVKIVF